MLALNQQAPIPARSFRVFGLRLFLALCVGIYSFAGAMNIKVISHDHDEPHVEAQHAPHSHDHEHEDGHEDSHPDGEGEHHHHISCHGSVAMASVDPEACSIFHRITKHSLLSSVETCPTGPTFEIIKPPQVG